MRFYARVWFTGKIEFCTDYGKFLGEFANWGNFLNSSFADYPYSVITDSRFPTLAKIDNVMSRNGYLDYNYKGKI